MVTGLACLRRGEEMRWAERGGEERRGERRDDKTRGETSRRWPGDRGRRSSRGVDDGRGQGNAGLK